MIPDSLIQEIKEKSNIVDVINKFITLNKRGSGYEALCPLHGEKTPSFKTLPNEKNFKCFGCHVGGDVFKFIMEYQKVTFPEAVKYLAKEYNIPISTKKLTPKEEEEYKERESLLLLLML